MRYPILFVALLALQWTLNRRTKRPQVRSARPLARLCLACLSPYSAPRRSHVNAPASRVVRALGLAALLICAGCFRGHMLDSSKFSYRHPAVRWVYLTGWQLEFPTPAAAVVSTRMGFPLWSPVVPGANGVIGIASAGPATVVLTENAEGRTDPVPLWLAITWKHDVVIDKATGRFLLLAPQPPDSEKLVIRSHDVYTWFSPGDLFSGNDPRPHDGQRVRWGGLWAVRGPTRAGETLLLDMAELDCLSWACYLPRANAVVVICDRCKPWNGGTDSSPLYGEWVICIDLGEFPEISQSLESRYLAGREAKVP